MDTFASTLIRTLGGSTALARMIDAPVTTIQSWKTNGIPLSRLNHIRLVAERDGIPVDWSTGEKVSADHAAVDTTRGNAASSGKGGEVSARAAAA